MSTSGWMLILVLGSNQRPWALFDTREHCEIAQARLEKLWQHHDPRPSMVCILAKVHGAEDKQGGDI